ncbi:MAG: GGDEF domain-containing protein [Dehalococcoidia bacterium]
MAIPEPPPVLTEAEEFGDAKFRRGIVVLRWMLFVAYVSFSEAGFGTIPVRGTELLVSAAIIGGWAALYTAFEVLRGGLRDGAPPRDHRILLAIVYFDIVAVTVAFSSAHDPAHETWFMYALVVMAVSHLLTRNEMLVYVGWAVVGFAGANAANQLRGDEISWATSAGVAVLLVFMGYNGVILASGEQRRRDLVAAFAVTDSLTRLPNRHFFHQAYPNAFGMASQHGFPVAVLMIDVDHFKEINDREGHPAGDDRLREVADAMQGVMRRGDLLARYGGDEFIAVLPTAGREAAIQLGERLREAADACGASVSVGVAIYPEDARDEESLIAAADKALYRAKEAGRNCVRDLVAA